MPPKKPAPKPILLNEEREEADTRVYRIYVLTNQVNGKKYAGQTCQELIQRWWKHVTDARAGAPWRISRAINKYGSAAFKMELLHDGLTKSQANLKEIETIKELDLLNPNTGYNMVEGGMGGPGGGPKRLDLNSVEIAEMYQNGMSINQISEKVSASTATVWKRLHQQKVEVKPAVCPRREDLRDEEIKSLYESGNASTYIAKKLGTCSSCVIDRLATMGVIRRPFRRPRLPFNEVEAVCMYLNGFTSKEIGKKLNVHPTTIINRFHMLGVEVNPSASQIYG